MSFWFEFIPVAVHSSRKSQNIIKSMAQVASALSWGFFGQNLKPASSAPCGSLSAELWRLKISFFPLNENGLKGTSCHQETLGIVIFLIEFANAVNL